MAGFTLCYKLLNVLDESYELKIFDAWVLPFLNYEVVLDDLRYVVKRVEVRPVGNQPVYFVLAKPAVENSFVEDSMLLAVAQKLLLDNPLKK